MPAATVPLKDWEFMQKYVKMMKVGLPRPVVEHKMLSEGCNPAVLDAPPDQVLPARMVSLPKRNKKKGPTVVRKKLHWVPIRGKVADTVWAGPPADLVAAQPQLIDDEKEFNRLFLQKPEDLKKKKKKGDDGGVIQLVDGKRAMNAGIALSKVKMPFTAIKQMLEGMSCKAGKYLLTLVELQNLVALAPTDEEVKLVKGFTGDVNRLGQCEKFFLSIADVPQVKARALGLWYQANFDDRIRETTGRIKLFQAAINQVRGGAERGSEGTCAAPAPLLRLPSHSLWVCVTPLFPADP